MLQSTLKLKFHNLNCSILICAIWRPLLTVPFKEFVGREGCDSRLCIDEIADDSAFRQVNLLRIEGSLYGEIQLLDEASIQEKKAVHSLLISEHMMSGE